MCGKINAESCILHDPTLFRFFRVYVLSCATAEQHPESNSVALQRESEINMFYALKQRSLRSLCIVFVDFLEHS